MIEIEALSMSYGGVLALDGLTLSIPEGAIFGYIGPNGAGKTTTFRILATLLRATSGRAIVDGFEVATQAADVRRSIGYMPDRFGCYEEMTVREYLGFFAALYEIGPKQRASVLDGVIELTDLGERQGVQVQTLSRGMQQRLGLARVLLHDPKVLLLDEPASGLDPRARVEMRELLKELRRMGKTVLISSHILKELADMCSMLGVIEGGKLLFSGAPDALRQRVEPRPVVTVSLRDRRAPALALLESRPEVRSARLVDQHLEVELEARDDDGATVLTCLVQQGYSVTAFEPRRLDLEACFMSLTRGGGL